MLVLKDVLRPRLKRISSGGTVGDFGEKSEKIQNIDKFCIYMAKNDIFVIKIHSSYEESKIEANCWTKKENNFFYIKVGCFDQNISRNLQNRLENMESLKML